MKPSTKGVYRNAIDRLCRSTDKDGNEIGGKKLTATDRPMTARKPHQRLSQALQL
jgi:hypothetical protein